MKDKKIFLDTQEKNNTSIKHRIHEIIYEADTSAGKLFDVILLIAILASILFVMLESVQSINDEYGDLLNIGEWIITGLFSIEYVLRIISIKKPWKYIFSFYGVIDFLSTIPKYLSLILVGSHNLAALRALRLLRVFRILKVTRYIGESNRLLIALKSSRAKIAVFLFFVLILCIILGTVGYGDIAPGTPLGQLIASAIMILGYAIIAIPTGIVGSEMMKNNIHINTQACQNCLRDKHRDDADFCYHCGDKLNE